ncbi:PRC-barrel domain-containing protein [Paractinoplanes hotanensis]|uniref:PRC-barrel domain-containing protein n=1 Tax=Paractinoplanes hotanensis TaxID=2906497 RepID=A0ABT0YCM7_9ACTN|nr:PRC-barrel domain-containing protein [Actinoplanes hotanensis]MCM4083826.1 PRC-barrel domain-containing protein [Actinoplanes hotanensis]
MTDLPGTLVRMKDSDKTIADPDRDIRGRTVRDRTGEDIGKVDDLLIDTEQEKIRFLRVEHGGLLGIGATPSFIPIDAITDVTGDEVRIDRSARRSPTRRAMSLNWSTSRSTTEICTATTATRRTGRRDTCTRPGRS